MLNMLLIIGWLLNVVAFIPFLVFTFKSKLHRNQKMRIILAMTILFAFFGLFVGAITRFY